MNGTVLTLYENHNKLLDGRFFDVVSGQTKLKLASNKVNNDLEYFILFIQIVLVVHCKLTIIQNGHRESIYVVCA